MAQRQINIRLPDDVVDVLESAAFLERAGSVPELLKPIIEREVEQRRTQPLVQAAMRLREEQAALDKRKDGKTGR